MIQALQNIKTRAEESSRLVSNFLFDLGKSLQNIITHRDNTQAKLNEIKNIPSDKILRVKSKFISKNTRDLENKISHGNIDLDKEFRDEIIKIIEERNTHIDQYGKILNNMVFIYRVAMFDAQLSDFLKTLLECVPNTLRSSKTLTAEQILNFNSLEEIKKHLVHKELMEFTFKTISDQLKFLKDKFNISIPESDISIVEIVEIIETRNIHVHNSGMVNQKYMQNVHNPIFLISNYRYIDDEYLAKTNLLLTKLIVALADIAMTKFR
jgi:hypothetical protein